MTKGLGRAGLDRGWRMRGAGGRCAVTHEVAVIVEAALVAKPVRLEVRVFCEQDLLAGERFLPQIRAVEGVVITEELLAVGLLGLPRRISEDGVEAGMCGPDHIRKRQLPVKEPMGARECSHNLPGGRRWRRKLGGGGQCFEAVEGPEPQGTPGVKGRAQSGRRCVGGLGDSTAGDGVSTR